MVSQKTGEFRIAISLKQLDGTSHTQALRVKKEYIKGELKLLCIQCFKCSYEWNQTFSLYSLYELAQKNKVADKSSLFPKGEYFSQWDNSLPLLSAFVIKENLYNSFNMFQGMDIHLPPYQR